MEDLSKYKLNTNPGPWNLTTNSSILLDDIHQDEGTIEYQTKTKTFKNGKFLVYKDTKGLPTIGYGHLLVEGEQFTSGITVDAANSMLQLDLIRTLNAAKKLATQYNMVLPELAQVVLTEMVFQLGIGGASKFKNTLSLLAKNDYKGAAREMRNSSWYKQTPNRVEKHASRLETLG